MASVSPSRFQDMGQQKTGFLPARGSDVSQTWKNPSTLLVTPLRSIFQEKFHEVEIQCLGLVSRGFSKAQGITDTPEGENAGLLHTVQKGGCFSC